MLLNGFCILEHAKKQWLSFYSMVDTKDQIALGSIKKEKEAKVLFIIILSNTTPHM